VVGGDKVWGVDLVSRFPRVVCFWIPFPFDKVLEHSRPAEVPIINDTLHLILLLSFQKVRQGPGIVWSMLQAFMIGR
jgi:hypothetical protein